MPNLFSEMEKMVINIECFSDTVEVRLAVCNQVVFIPITKNWRNGTETKVHRRTRKQTNRLSLQGCLSNDECLHLCGFKNSSL